MKCAAQLHRWALLAFVANASLVMEVRPAVSYLCCAYALLCKKKKKKKKKKAAHTDTLKYYHLHGHSGNVISIFAPLPDSVNAHLFDVFRAAAQMPQSKLCRTSSRWLFLRIKGRGMKKKKRQRERQREKRRKEKEHRHVRYL